MMLSVLPPSSLLLPPDEGGKFDIQINTMLAYAVYMMIVAEYIPPFADKSGPRIGK